MMFGFYLWERFWVGVAAGVQTNSETARFQAGTSAWMAGYTLGMALSAGREGAGKNIS